LSLVENSIFSSPGGELTENGAGLSTAAGRVTLRAREVFDARREGIAVERAENGG
jgi:hypothetical protein